MTSYESLLARIRQVRRRWRPHVLVKGISLFLASAIGLLVLGVWGADLFGFRPAAVWVMRLLAGGTVLFVGWYFLYVPLRARVRDVQIAQYIEEKYPQLEDRLVTAVEYGGQSTASSGMIDLLIKDALDKTSRVDLSIFLSRRRLLSFGSLGIAAFAGNQKTGMGAVDFTSHVDVIRDALDVTDLPEPLSPVIRTVLPVLATLAIS